MSTSSSGCRSSWSCPSVALVVPGLLLILAVLAQSLGALAWLPFVKRTLGEERSPGHRRRHTFA